MSKNTLGHRGLKFFVLSVFASSWAVANITGTVYKDFNLNGQKDGGDAFVSGVSMKATCEDGNTYTATTDANGAYTLTGFPAGNKCRVEADASNAGVGSGPNASGSAPLVAIVPDGSVHNISTGSPATYCQANPDVVMAAMPGHYLYSGVQKNPAGFGTLFKVPTPNIGDFNNNGTIPANRTTLAKTEDTGAVWGTAWKKGTKDLFVAANLKRYVELKGDAGAIYKVDNAGAILLFATVPNVTTAAANIVIAARTHTFNEDKEVLPFVARQGLGDIDINEAETELYTVNMNTKELVIINPDTGAMINNVAIPNPYGAECPAEDVRPWALKVRGTDVFIGSVCESKIDDDLGAAVQKYNGAIFQTIAKTNSLRYLRARSYGPANQGQDDGNRFANWTDESYRNGPILTDIEFTNSGDLVLGYTARSTYNRISSLYGDIRKMCLNPDGSYTDESSDVAATDCATHTVNYSGNPTDYLAFYTGDYFGANFGETGHPETASGALAQAPGAPNIIVGMIDGTDWWQPGAIGLYSNTTGDKIGAQAVIDNTPEGERWPYGAKAGGLGDVELLCDPAPIEVGNYVWMDINQDGIQDANEPAMANVPVTLTCNGTQIGTALTDAQGHYYFGGLNNANLTGGNVIGAGQNCELSIAQADVNGKPPTVTDPANVDDGIDNDAVASGTDNVISFTTTASNDHSLDFGIEPALGCVTGTLFEDTVVNGTLDLGDTRAPIGINLLITDAFGNSYESTTDAQGAFTLSGIPAGNVTVKVDTTDTDIPEGSVWTTSTLTVAVTEGVAPTCATTLFPYTLPAPTAQDPKDVAVCANPTSLTWEGATVSSKSNWTTPVVDIADTFTTVDDDNGATPTVGVTMKIINNTDGKYNAAESGTSAAFGQPYLTLYLGNQAAAGNGTWNDAGNCAANGYDLEAGESYDLEVTFDAPVILDNWRIRDVDSGDVRAGNPNWNWQDGIKVQGFDANGDPVEVEPKIGSAGVGLIVDANGIVHTDPATYNGGNVAAGTGSTPNATNGHIVLSSNMVPLSKIVITHVAGPDVACQTRSALAMAGLAVCKPLHISGHVYNDEDGVNPTGTCVTSNNKVDGTPISDLDGAALHACLVDDKGKVLDTQAIANGAYDFDKYILPNASYKVLLTTATCTKSQDAPTAVLAENWNYEGEQIDPTNTPGHDVPVDGSINVAVASADIPNIDFAINKSPTALDYTRPGEINPSGTTQVTFDPTDALIGDNEETAPTKIKITQIPTGSTIYYAGTAVAAGEVIDNPVMTSFSIDPAEGDVSAGFTYISMDKSCRESKPAYFKASFGVPKISGFLYLDKNNNDQVDDNATSKSCDATTSLYVNLIGKVDNKVIASSELDDEGSYVFYNPDVQPNTSYDLVLSQIEGQAGDPAPSAELPEGCMHTAENKGENATNPEGTAGDGVISVDVVGTDVPELNFGISPSVKIGDKVWIEDDNDGDATTGTVTPVVGTTVTANCGGVPYTAVTDAAGLYGIEVPQNSTCIVSLPAPQGRSAAQGSDDADVSDTTSENDKTHNPEGTTVTVGTTDNMTLDFGFSEEVEGTYKIGTHFWIDTNANGVFDAGEKPVDGALIELFDANGSKISDTTTANGGAYGFDVPAGTYQVKFNIPDRPEFEGFVFSKPKANANDTLNVNSANNKGFTQTVTVGPNAKTEALTMDAGINCGCANVSSDSSDALSTLNMLAIMFFTLITALYFVRKEEQNEYTNNR